ncbi:hypothetical protein [Brucella intermedia]
MRGEAPSPVDPPQGCAFHPRCPLPFFCRSGDIPVFTNSPAVPSTEPMSLVKTRLRS